MQRFPSQGTLQEVHLGLKGRSARVSIDHEHPRCPYTWQVKGEAVIEGQVRVIDGDGGHTTGHGAWDGEALAGFSFRFFAALFSLREKLA